MGNKSGFAQFVEHFGLKPGQEQAERAEKVEDVPARTGGSSGWAQFKKAYGLSAPSSMAGTPPAGSITTPEEQEKMRQDAVAQVGAFAGELVSNAGKVSAENKPMLDYQEYLKQTGQEVDTSKLVKGSAEYNAFLDGFYRWQGDKYLADASASTEKKQSLFGEQKSSLMDEIKVAQQSGDPAAIMDAVKRYKAQYDTDSAALDQNYTDNKMNYWANRMNFSDFESKGKYAPKVQSFYDEDSYYKNYLSMPEAERKPIWDTEISFADALYESVNGNYLMFIKLNNDERLFKDPLRQKLKWDRNSATSSTLHLDAEERQIFNYIFETEGVDKAIEFLNDMHDTLDARYDQYFIKKQQEWAKEDPFGNSLATVVSSPFRAALGAVGTVADLIGDGELEKDAWYSQLNRDVAVTRGAIGDQIRDSWAGNVGGFLYDAGMSAGDSAMNTLTMGGLGLTGNAAQWGSSILTGSDAAVTAMDDALARGLSSGQALTLGIIAGLGETVMDKISLDKIFGKTNTVSGSALKQWVKGGAAEGKEEALTELLNTVADVLVSQDKSKWQMAVDAYKEKGYDENTAIWRAIGNKALELGYNYASGFAAGGMMSGTNMALHAGQVRENSQAHKALKAYLNEGLSIGSLTTEQIQGMVNEGLALGKDTDSYKLAQKIQKKLDTGKMPKVELIAELVEQSYVDADGKEGAKPVSIPQIDTKQQPGNDPTTNPAPSPAPIDMDELIDSSIASIHNAPADPLRAAMEGFKTTGAVTNSQARDILNNTRAVQQLIQQTGIQLPDTASGRRAAVKQAVAHLAQQQKTSPIDTAQNTDYDNQNTTGGMNHAEGLHQNDRAGSSGDSAQGMAGIQSGDGSGVEGWGQHGQVAVDPGIFRVSDELSAAQQKRGTPVYAVQDTSATPERYEQSLIAGRNSDTTYGKDDYDAAMAYRDGLMEQQSQNQPTTSVGAAPADFTGKSAFNDLLSDENAQPDRPDDVRPMEIPKTDAYGRHVSETAANIYGSEITPDHAADMVQELVAEGALGFDTKTNAQLLSQAAEEIKEDGLGASKGKVKDAVSKGAHKDTDIAKAVMLYTLYANKNTDTSQEEAAELMVDLCTMANDAGRKLQLFKLIRRMTPAGQLLSVEKGINRAVERINGRRSKKNQASVQIPQSLKNEYLAAAAKDMELQTTESAKAKEDAEQAMYKIAASQIKGSLMEKLNAWRYMSMLGNVKTQLRNVGGNLAFRSMVNAKRALGSVLESITLDKEKRTKSILGVGPKSQALLKWAKEDANTQTARNMLSYCAQTGDTARNAIEDNRQIYDHQWLENVRKFVQAVPEAADMVFKYWEYSVSLASFMKARGYTVDDLSAGTVPDHILNEGRSYAAQEALKATFNDLNAFSNLMTKLRYSGNDSLRKAIDVLVEGVLPFRRTPANIAVRALEYSPVNLLKSVTWNVAKLKSGEMTGAQFIDQIAAGATGTGAAVLGWLLASGLLGIRLRGRVDDEDEKNAGHQSYSIEIGGKSYTVDWLAPTNIPFFMGANFYETGQATDADWFSTFLQSSVGTFEPMLELSCLSSVNDLLETVQYSQGEPWWAIATSAATSYLNQYLPTLVGQIEQATESEKKIPYSDASTPFGRTVERFIGKATQKIPVIDLFQAEKYDSRGNPEKTTGWGEALLSPSYASEISDDPVDQEIARLNQAQSTNVSFPSPPKTLSYTDSSGTYHEDYRLSASEYETMGRVQGQTQYQLLSQLMKSEDYAALSDKEKATAVESVYKYAKEKAAIETFPDHAGFSSAWMSGVEEQGADVILHKTVENSFTGAFSALTESWSSGWSDDAALTELEDAYTTFSALPDNTRTAIKSALTGRCTAYVEAREAGMSTDTFSELYRQYRQISDSDLSPSDKAQKWAHVLEQSVERHQISTSQRDLMKEELGFAAIISQDSEGYDKMLAAGVSSDSADLISDILRDIMPEDGHSSVRPIQKLEAIAESDELTDEELERILPLYMSSDSTRQRYDMALDKGFSSEEFVVAYRIYLDKDGETKTQLIRQMANELDIPYALARQLYEIHSQRLSNE